MSEQPPLPEESVETCLLNGQPLAYWHATLCWDEEAREDIGSARTFSRYGSTTRDCAWFAIAAEWVYVDANGPDPNPHEGIQFMMGLAVNDHEDVEALIREHFYSLPGCLRELVEMDDD